MICLPSIFGGASIFGGISYGMVDGLRLFVLHLLPITAKSAATKQAMDTMDG
jgi:hypothetical protein